MNDVATMFVNPDAKRYEACHTQKWLEVCKECRRFTGLKSQCRSGNYLRAFRIRFELSNEIGMDKLHVLADWLEEHGYPRPDVSEATIPIVTTSTQSGVICKSKHYGYLKWSVK